MRQAITIVALLLFASLPIIDAESETIHLWSEEPPGSVLLWDDSGNLTNLDPELPIDIHLPSGNWTLVRLVDGIPQDNPLTFNQDTNASNFLSEVIEEPRIIAGDAHLDLLGTIEQAAELNATWSSTMVSKAGCPVPDAALVQLPRSLTDLDLGKPFSSGGLVTATPGKACDTLILASTK